MPHWALRPTEDDYGSGFPDTALCCPAKHAAKQLWAGFGCIIGFLLHI